MKTRIQFVFAIPVVLTLAFTVLAMTGASSILEYRILDGFLALRPAPPQNPNIVLVDIDDPAIRAIGTWPISRNITANGLMLLAELGAKQATFDIEYTDKSPRGVNAEILEQEIPQTLDTEMGRLKTSITDLFGAVESGQISMKDTKDYVQDLAGVTDQTKDEIKNAIQSIALDNDQYLANAARFFGSAYFTVHMLQDPDDSVSEELRAYTIERFSLKDATVQKNAITTAVDILPVLHPIIDQSKGVGFTNADIDSDGIRRRIMLVQAYNDNWFPQLVFRPLLDVLGNPKVTILPRWIVLAGAKMPDGTVTDIRIPISVDGKTLLDWPHSTYADSFKHVSFYNLYTHDQLFSHLVQNLKVGESGDWLHAYEGKVPLSELARQSEILRNAIMNGTEPVARVADYAALRERFLSELGTFLATKPETQVVADLDAILSDTTLDAETRAQFEGLKKDIPDFYAKTRDIYETLIKMREMMKTDLDGAFCILGQTNTGSTDLGANPFAKSYPNIGTHATLVNMILNRKFLLELSPLWSALLALIFGLGTTILTKEMRPSRSISTGLAITVGTLVFAGVLFVLTGRYLAIVPLAGPILLSFIATTFIKFFVAEKEKSFIRNAFSHYLSADVIKQIIANPDKLRLGGEQKYMTAMFTDIQGFSTISEKMSPVELVDLLNRYLTDMSNQVLEMGGTIDKYEGDAIIAFFGAPIDLEDHASRALHAAIRMKRIEEMLNVKFLAEKSAPSPLKTRIGINSGEMVVGNMGTDRKMDYTIIGDAVNLAARLEGVNKRYGTYMCVSETTMHDAGPGFIFRRLDKIRVVGKAVPIQIFELVDEEGKISDEKANGLALFEQAHVLFEQREWVKAMNKFNEVFTCIPGDGPSTRFIATCKEYIKVPPPELWDGVYQMDMK